MGQTLYQQDFRQIYAEARDFTDNAAGAVMHGFFGRRGGVSGGIYESLNCGQGSDDEPQSVKENRNIVARAMGVGDMANLLSVHQVHGDTCITAEGPWSGERPKGDALVTDRPCLALGILTADCGPVLFTGKKADGSPVIGAAHAGWGGAIGGILKSTLAAMKRLGAEEGSIRACVGPCIAQASYEVGPEFRQRFMDHDHENDGFFRESRKTGHFMFDLPGYIAARLSKAGVKHVTLTDLDTYAREDEFFSYRRATHRGEPDYGRQVSAIVIKNT